MGDDDFLLLVIAQVKVDISHAQRRFAFMPVEDDIRTSFTSESFKSLPSHHPEKCIDDVALTCTVGSGNSGYSRVKKDFCFFREGFKSLEFELFDNHLFTNDVLDSSG